MFMKLTDYTVAKLPFSILVNFTQRDIYLKCFQKCSKKSFHSGKDCERKDINSLKIMFPNIELQTFIIYMLHNVIKGFRETEEKSVCKREG